MPNGGENVVVTKKASKQIFSQYHLRNCYGNLHYNIFLNVFI